MEILELPIRKGDLASFIKDLPDGSAIMLDPSGMADDVVPHSEGVLVKRSDRSADSSVWWVNGLDTVEQVNWRRQDTGEGDKYPPILAPIKWPDPGLKHQSVFIDASGRLNGEIPVSFAWKQFWGHPYGALFRLEDDALVLVLHRNQSGAKSSPAINGN